MPLSPARSAGEHLWNPLLQHPSCVHQARPTTTVQAWTGQLGPRSSKNHCSWEQAVIANSATYTEKQFVLIYTNCSLLTRLKANISCANSNLSGRKANVKVTNDTSSTRQMFEHLKSLPNMTLHIDKPMTHAPLGHNWLRTLVSPVVCSRCSPRLSRALHAWTCEPSNVK
jgi:hypothetical protein